MNAVRVRFKQLVVSPAYGNCGPGDVVVCDPGFARHVVDDLGCAEYLEKPVAPAPKVIKTAADKPAAPARKKK